MMKKLIGLLLVLLALFQLFGCKENKQDSSNTTTLFYHYYLQQFDKENVLVNSIGSDGETNIVNTQKSYILNIQSGVSAPLFENFQGEIIYDSDQYDKFDPEDFIALNRPSLVTKDYELGRFQKSTGKYTSLIKDPDVSMLYDSIPDNLVIYTQAKNGKNSYNVSTELSFMNRDGTNKRNIPLGTNATIHDYHRLDKNRGCFGGYNTGPKFLNVIFLVNHSNQTITKLMEVGKSYDFLGIVDKQILFRISDLQYRSAVIYLCDFDGNNKKQLFATDFTTGYNNFRFLLDLERGRLYYSYQSPDQKGEILLYNFNLSKTFKLFNQYWEYGKCMPLDFFNKENVFFSYILNTEDKNIWHLCHLDTGKVDEIPLPKDTNFRLSTDGKYLMCMNIGGNDKKSGIMDYETKKLKVFTTNLEVDNFSPFYIESTQEFYFNLRGNHDGNKVYIVKPSGEIRLIKLFEVSK